MNWITIVIVAVTIVGVLLLVLIEDAVEKLIDWLSSLVGLHSGKGPLTAETVVDGERTILSMVNQGKHPLRLAGIEGRDHRGERKFPTPYSSEDDFCTPISQENALKRFSQVSLNHGEVTTAFLKTSELAALDCQALAVLDSRGSVWPVESYNSADIISIQQSGGGKG